ncbi:MAG: glycoside hydrolase family 13 protein [Bacteroidetes bacterium]|nr:glycoside hydrolase family 13 protein [Bacteroidota bacterium]
MSPHKFIRIVIGCCVCLTGLVPVTHAQVNLYPTHWWVGMKNPKLQVMLHGANAATQQYRMEPYAGVTLGKVTKAESPNYVFFDLTIAPSAKAGTLIFHAMTGNTTTFTFRYELKARRTGNGTAFAQGVRSDDFIYLLMPDRFSNGDPSNDRIAGMRDQSLNRDSIFLRHGGDMQGVINHLDYLQGLGVTALWMTPVLENDMPNRTEHGYAFTDHYTIEPRLGGADAYKKLSDELHHRGMKLVQDAVYNHVGLWHFTVQDPPMRDWLHQWPAFTHPNYKDQTQFDIHAAQSDKKLETDGWFTPEMPDLNQNNPYVANFLIQHAIWCVEEFGVDGWRIDTYVYLDLPFMNRCNKALTDEYPRITMFGEAWVTGTANEAYFTRNNINTPFKSNLTGVTDFQCLFDGIQPSVKQGPDGVNRLYQTLSNDILYENPMNNVIFLDNHDMTRFYTEVGEDIAKQKMGLAWLLTERGIPQLYYGTEVLMKGKSDPDGWVRLDFPGGWPGDAKNAFTGQGLGPQEADVLQYTKRFALFRKSSSAIKTGRLMQYAPENGVYVYFRYDNKQTVMCVMNTTDAEQTIDMARFAERAKGFTKAFDVATGVEFALQPTLSLGGKYLLVMELRK